MVRAMLSAMRKECRRDDLGKGTRGKYYRQFRRGSNLVLLSPDVAAGFPDERSVNDALRGLLQLAKQSTAVAAPGAGGRPKTRV